MPDKQQRKLNWPGLEHALRHYNDIFLRKEHKPAIKKAYLDGTAHDTYSNIVNLMIHPDSDEADWKRWKLKNDNPGHFLLFQMNDSLYVGNNSVLNGREKEIYDYCFLDSGPDKLRKADKLSRVIGSGFGRLNDHIGRIEASPYQLAWRSIERHCESVLSNGELKLPSFRDSEDSEFLKRLFCPTAWAYKHGDNLDPTIHRIAESVHRTLSTEAKNTQLGDAYAYFTEKYLTDFGAYSFAGGVMHLCIRYENSDLLQAAIELLDPLTRYPYGDGNPDETIRCLPRTKPSTEYRISWKKHMRLWRAGFKVNKYEIANDNDLILEVPIPIDSLRLLNAVDALGYDNRNVREKISAKKNMLGDTSEDHSPTAPIVYIEKSISGEWRVGTIPISKGTEIDKNYKNRHLSCVIRAGSDDHIDQLVDVKNINDSLLGLADEYEYLRDHGVTLNW